MTTTELADRPFVLARTGTAALTGLALTALRDALGPRWTVTATGHLRRSFAVADFASALALAVRIGLLAERLDHHPELTVRWGEVVVELWTHTVGGLAEGDFVFAARCDRL